MRQAPVIPAGSHLDYWDSKDEALVSARNMEVYNHWGPVDTDARLPPERMSELFGTLATYYQPPPAQVLPSNCGLWKPQVQSSLRQGACEEAATEHACGFRPAASATRQLQGRRSPAWQCAQECLASAATASGRTWC